MRARRDSDQVFALGADSQNHGVRALLSCERNRDNSESEDTTKLIRFSQPLAPSAGG